MSHMKFVREMAGSNETPVELALHTLKRSKLPTLVVEGYHDKAIYRWLEKLLDMPKINLLPVDGRDNLLEIYRKRSEFDSQLPVAFMADLDKWVFDRLGIGGQADYEDIIWTTGYSLENDLYSDGKPENTYIDPTKRDQHRRELDNAICEFAYQVASWAARGRLPNSEDIANYYEQITEEYELKLRGKDLFEVLSKFCKARNHLELCQDVFNAIDLTTGNPPLLSSLILKIQYQIRGKLNAIKKARPSQKFIAESLYEKLSK